MHGDRLLHGVFGIVRALSGCRSSVTSVDVPPRAASRRRLPGTFPVAVAFAEQRLSAGPPVHYRDETDISGLVAPGDHSITRPSIGESPAPSRRSGTRAGGPRHGRPVHQRRWLAPARHGLSGSGRGRPAPLDHERAAAPVGEWPVPIRSAAGHRLAAQRRKRHPARRVAARRPSDAHERHPRVDSRPVRCRALGRADRPGPVTL